MTLVEIYPAIALTSAAFAFYALLYSRFKNSEDKAMAILSVWAALNLFAIWYLGFEEPIETIPQMMLATVNGITMGAGIVAGIVYVVRWLRNRPTERGDRL